MNYLVKPMLDSLPVPSSLLFWGFIVLPLLVAGLIIYAINHCVGRAAGRIALLIAIMWIGISGFLGWSGYLDAWTPPRMFFLLAPILLLFVWTARSSWGERLGDLPLKLLVGFQSFRIVVELLLHAAVLEGVANPNMTWSGTNLDIIPGVTALLLVPFVTQLDRRILQAWNLIMAGVLVVTVVTGMMSAPTPFRQFFSDPPNVFIAGFPFVWLPTVLVSAAWFGHIVLYRRLRRE